MAVGISPSGERVSVDRKHVLGELDFRLEHAGDGLRGHATVNEHMHVTGTDVLRASILATWSDTVTGLVCAKVVEPRVPVTLELDLHLYGPPVAPDEIVITGHLVKAGKDVLLSTVDIADGTGDAIGSADATFMLAPDETLRLPMPVDELVGAVGTMPGRLAEPFAERAGCERREPGVAWMPPTTDEQRNSSNTLNGGLIALLVEEAAVSTRPGSSLSSLIVHFARPIRTGPAVARATVHGDVAEVVVTDEGRGDLAVKATARFF